MNWKDLLTKEEIEHLSDNGIDDFEGIIEQYHNIRKFQTLYPNTKVCYECEAIIRKLIRKLDGEI